MDVRITYNYKIWQDKVGISGQSFFIGLDEDYLEYKNIQLLAGSILHTENSDTKCILVSVRNIEHDNIPIWDIGKFRPKNLYEFRLFTNNPTIYINSDEISVGKSLILK